MHHRRSSGFRSGTTAYVSPIAGIAHLYSIDQQQYADDTQLFISLSPSDYMLDLHNFTRCIDSLHIWFCANGMALNPDKSEAILLGTRQRAHSYSNLATVNVAGSQIPLTDHIKILGVTLDKNLSMNNHVNAVCKSIHYHIRALRHIRSSISSTLTTLTLFYLEPLRKTSPNSKKPRTSSPVLLPVLLNHAVHVLSSSSSTGSRLNTAWTSK